MSPPRIFKILVLPKPWGSATNTFAYFAPSLSTNNSSNLNNASNNPATSFFESGSGGRIGNFFLTRPTFRTKIESTISQIQNVGTRAAQNKYLSAVMSPLLARVNSREDFLIAAHVCGEPVSIEFFTPTMSSYDCSSNSSSSRPSPSPTSPSFSYNTSLTSPYITTPNSTATTSANTATNSISKSEVVGTYGPLLAHLNATLIESEAHHSAWEQRTLYGVPFFIGMGLLPGPNIFLCWALYRLWCHHRCRKGAMRLREAINTKSVHFVADSRATNSGLVSPLTSSSTLPTRIVLFAENLGIEEIQILYDRWHNS